MTLRDWFLQICVKRIPSRRWGESGTVAITVALTLVLMLLFVGLAVDMGRAYLLRQGMQAQIDSAGLAVAARNTSNLTVMERIANNTIRENKALTIRADFDPVAVSFNTATFDVSLSLTGRMSTSFMSLAGITQLPLTVTSTILRPRRLDVALIIDTSSSMSRSMGAGRTRFDNVREAANALIDILMPVPAEGSAVNPDDPLVRIGLVPFTTLVNIGTQWRDSTPNWLTIPIDATRNTNCRLTGDVNCQWVDTKCDGVPCRKRRCSGEQICDTRTATWQGCVGMRSLAYRNIITESEVDRYPGEIPARDELCGPKITYLTGDRTDVFTAIDALAPLAVTTQTYIPSGLTWAWNMLTPEAPLSDPRTFVNMSAQGQRAIILMSDGLNTAVPANDGNGAAFSPFNEGNPPYTNALTRQLCSNIRRTGIRIYTVLLQVNNSQMARLMSDCSAVAGRSFNVESRDQLNTAFQDIARQLQGVRLTQ